MTCCNKKSQSGGKYNPPLGFFMCPKEGRVRKTCQWLEMWPQTHPRNHTLVIPTNIFPHTLLASRPCSWHSYLLREREKWKAFHEPVPSLKDTKMAFHKVGSLECNYTLLGKRWSQTWEMTDTTLVSLYALWISKKGGILLWPRTPSPHCHPQGFQQFGLYIRKDQWNTRDGLLGISWVQILAHQFTSCIILGKWLEFSRPPSPSP